MIRRASEVEKEIIAYGNNYQSRSENQPIFIRPDQTAHFPETETIDGALWYVNDGKQPVGDDVRVVEKKGTKQMVKVRCVDNSCASRELRVGTIYNAEYGVSGCYKIDGKLWFQWRFEVVKDEEQMTHRQKMKELLPIIQAYCDGAEVEVKNSDNKWNSCKDPYFYWYLEYRIKQTPDTIDWSHVHKDYKFMARNMNGRAYFHTQRPDKKANRFNSMHSAAVSQSSYKQGTVSWEDSLVERPEGV